MLSLSWLLVNFFYAPKLLDCRLDAGWMTPVILGYSLVQMLGKGILAALAKRPRAKVAGMFCALAAAAMAALGLTRRTLPAVSLMLLLPLLLTVPGYCLSALENTFISRLGQDENRAAALSMLSMGTHLMEILALFASAALTATGPELCFPAVGILLLTCGIGFALKN